MSQSPIGGILNLLLHHACKSSCKESIIALIFFTKIRFFRCKGGRSWCRSVYTTIQAIYFNVACSGAGGLTAVNQLHKSLKKNGKTLTREDIVIVDPAEYHYYQPGW
jgi:hypothetical protein